MKKILLVGSAALAATLFVAGCGGSSSTPDGRPIKERPQSGEKIQPPESQVGGNLQGADAPR